MMDIDNPQQTGTRLEGRELAAQVAERVMKWEHLAGDTWVDREQNQVHPNFRPDKLISAAWLVVEKIVARTGFVHLEVDDEGCAAEIWHDPNNTSDWVLLSEAQADTAPLAICRAALKAVETE